MAVYEANIRSLAEFISDTKLGFMPSEVTSTTGYRRDGSSYKISAHKIKCDRIYVVSDCFIDYKGNVIVTSYIPAIEYYLITNELSSCYNRGDHLSFKFKANSQVLKYEIENDIVLKTYDDFEECFEKLMKFIESNIEKSINNFEQAESWEIENVKCDITWQVDKVKKK